jgi:hypothetical protein
MDSHPLLADIEAFIATHGMAESTFGRDAVNDWKFIGDLRGGGDKRPRRVWPETEAKVRRFMATYKPAPTQAAAA